MIKIKTINYMTGCKKMPEEYSLVKTQETWDTIAESFDTTRQKPWKQCIEFIETIPKNSTTVDLGCGNGRHLIPCARHCKKVIGIDISKKLLQITQEKIKKNNLKNITLIHSDATYIPLKNNTIDVILFVAALHNIKGRDKRVQTLKEIKRVLKKNGQALITVWSRWQEKYRKEFFKKWFIRSSSSEFGDINIYWRQHGLNIPRFYHLYSKKEFIKDLKEAGLEILTVQDVKIHSKKHPDNYFAICKK